MYLCDGLMHSVNGTGSVYNCVIDFAARGVTGSVVYVDIPIKFIGAASGYTHTLILYHNGVEVWRGNSMYHVWLNYTATIIVRDGDTISLRYEGSDSGSVYYEITVLTHDVDSDVPEIGLCGVFKRISDAFIITGDRNYQLAAYSDSWLIIGGTVAAAFTFLGDSLTYIGDLFLTAYEWCLIIGDKVKNVIDLDAITSHIASSFSLAEIYNFFTSVDEWFTSKFNAYIQPVTEAINDLKSYVDNKIDSVTVLLPDWLPTSSEEFNALVQSLIPAIPELPDNLEEWLNAKLEGFKDTVILWVSESIESILDKVFE